MLVGSPRVPQTGALQQVDGGMEIKARQSNKMRDQRGNLTQHCRPPRVDWRLGRPILNSKTQLIVKRQTSQPMEPARNRVIAL